MREGGPAIGANARRRVTGGRLLAEMLALARPGPIFGMGGFQLLPFYEACRALGLEHRLINDERCGAFAADGWARITNRPGLCDATLGPGATNLVTGLVESLNAGIPLIAIVGDTHRAHAWKNMTQEARQTEILRPAVKELIRIERTERIPELLRRAYTVATSGRPGPVVLDVPEDVAHEEIEIDAGDLWLDPATLEAPARPTRPDPRAVEQVAAMLARAERPLLLAGGGIHLARAWDALAYLVEEQRIPVAHTMSGKGAIACTHPLSAGLFGRYSRIANDLIARADLLVAVGCKLGEIATRRYQLLPEGIPLVQIEIVPEEIGRTARVTVGLAGDARLALEDLAAALGAPRVDRTAWVAEVALRMERWREEAMPRLRSDERPIHMARLVHEIQRALPEDGVLVADGGFAAHWAGLLFDTRRAGRHFLADRGFASIGYGLPGALGASLAAPDRAVVGLTGDGGCNMVLGELETARRLGAAFTLVVVNNAASGYVKALQHAMYGAYQSSDLIELDYATIARAMGCRGIRVEDPAELAPALAAGLAERSVPTVVDVVVTRDPARMLPAVDSRVLRVSRGDRPA
ncbi:MAG: thiamine pyrophosphate-binding protein [Geminicoccaceae bacterium]|nr:thiamine pyrophosphate-binding protein [Geminicoccaceae bacterium]MCX8100355.1 thiamine pyrophosphate-binding protein [Geminicoccaceae bacterium]MDW8368846.1 thiamine pyrophosphate-binding protein [Geminicoccaceae bacterium]